MIKGWKNNPQWREYFAAEKERRDKKIAEWRRMQWASEQAAAKLNALLERNPGRIIEAPRETPRETVQERFARIFAARTCKDAESV